MTLVKRFVAVIMLMSVFAFAFAAIEPTTAQGQARPAPPMPVKVVNTLADPVPVEVQGTARVAGTVNVRQSGDWNVNVTDAPGTPFSLQLCALEDETPCPIRPAPAWVALSPGQRFVIEFLSIRSTHAACYLDTVLNGVLTTNSLFLDVDHHRISFGLVRIYADGGFSRSISLRTEGGACEVTLTGYLISIPA